MAAQMSRRKESPLAVVLWSVALAVILFFILFLSPRCFPPPQGSQEQFALPVASCARVMLINFSRALQYARSFRYFLNSLGVSVVTTVVAVFIALLGAYGFSRLQFPAGSSSSR